MYRCSFRAKSFAWNQIRSNLCSVDCPTALKSMTFDTNRRICWRSFHLHHKLIHRAHCRSLLWCALLMRSNSCWRLKNGYRSTMDGTHRRHFEANYLIDALQVVLYQWIFGNYSSVWANYPLRSSTMTGDSLHFRDCYWYDCGTVDAIPNDNGNGNGNRNENK